MRKAYVLFVVVLIVLTLSSCTSQQTESSSNQGDLEIGETANFSNYSITVNSVVPQGEDRITANVTIKAKSDMTFESKYFHVYEGDNRFDHSDESINENISAGDSFSAVLTFPNKNISGLKWDDSGDVAMWRFDPVTEPAPGEVFDKSLAIEVLEEHGEQEYPDGFELLYDDSRTTETMANDTDYEFVIPCKVTSNGNTEEKTCTAKVSGIGSDIGNYSVTQFEVN